MFTKGIVITLLYLSHVSLYRADNQTESSEELARNCCIRYVHIIESQEVRCNFENSNTTATATISYDRIADISCCTSCLQEILKKIEKPGGTKNDELEDVITEAKMDSRRSCFETCSSNNTQSFIRVRTEMERKDDNVGDKTVGGNDTTTTATVVPEKSLENETRLWHCDSVFTSLNFWGANIVIFANAIYIVPYIIVVLVYAVVPNLSVRAYNKAVISYNASRLTIMFFTIASTFWLLVICIDITLTITRFRRASPNDSTTRYREEEKRKFTTYAIWTWGGSLLPTALACVAELSPLLPKSSPIRPNFDKFQDGANIAVILYVASFPALICLANSILFCYTSYKMYIIQKSTKLAAMNSNSLKIRTARKRYFLFLRLYLLMDAPWITSALAAAFTDLWVLKFLRMIQPMLMLLAILPSHMIGRFFTRSRYKHPNPSLNHSSKFYREP
ncbi:uncharacterized protein LOC143184941 isoform X2 [Calliopsis andreniformis]|uniref:uncharacterized protein LOC143184941 isoform X2 n=1 Tax=Calliopsis andreniformis TaxID=337506 RepID=UPI003FCC9ECD